MMRIEHVLVWSAILTFVMALAGSYYRSKGLNYRYGLACLCSFHNAYPRDPDDFQSFRVSLFQGLRSVDRILPHIENGTEYVDEPALKQQEKPAGLPAHVIRPQPIGQKRRIYQLWVS